MGYGRKKSTSSPEAAPVQVPDFNVTGSLNPDSTCNYYEEGVYNDAPYYKRVDLSFFLWQGGTILTHFVSSILGDTSGPYWVKAGLGWVGDYIPQNGASGVATVSEGAH